MKFKSGVRIDFMYPAMADLINVVQATVPKGYCPTITSANDSKHSENSLHYADKAYDIRVFDFPGFSLNEFEETKFRIFNWISEMKSILKKPHEYDIVFGDPQHKNHIHIEWDPKDAG